MKQISYLITVILCAILTSIGVGYAKNMAVPKTVKPDNFIMISYSDLIDRSILTHDGEEVGQVISKLPKHSDNMKGLVQQYLEPFSLLCNDVLLSMNNNDSLPLINILSYYPVGSEQPVWASMFREGNYQLYFNSEKIRLFVKGSNPKNGFNENQSVVRHAIQNVIDRFHATVKKIEVYAFINNYEKMEIKLNATPEIFSVKEINLKPRHKSLDLESLDNFLKIGVRLEAVEVDQNNLILYGKKTSPQTLAGVQLSLSDLAVIYRAFFHYGNNSPYISLDKNEDNRFAKVNFGGLLENTRVGNVVLEADKLFKTLSTGIDPNTHEIVKSKISNFVPGFLTEDERSLLENVTQEHSQIRYWFYPDSIETITDGNIGVISSYKFFADVERMDNKVSVSRATRETINHLNKNFQKYEVAEKTFSELSTVGRIMAVINWLRGMKKNEVLELDDFLAVILPPVNTPKTTKKMIAVSLVSYPKDLKPSENTIQAESKVFYMSELLDGKSPNVSDDSLLANASNLIKDMKDIAVSSVKNLSDKIDKYAKLIEDGEAESNKLGSKIERKRNLVDRTNDYELNDFNKLVDEYNKLVKVLKLNIKLHNEAVEELNAMSVNTQQIASVGGGIDLNPSNFKILSNVKATHKIIEFSGIKNADNLNVSLKPGDWVKNILGTNHRKVNLLPETKWKYSSNLTSNRKKINMSNAGDYASLSITLDKKEYESNVSVNGRNDIVKIFKDKRQIYVNHGGIMTESLGTISADFKNVKFVKKSH